MARSKPTPKQNNKRRGSLDILRTTIGPSITKTAQVAATKTRQMLAKATEVLKASVGEGPAVVHLHPERMRRGSRYSEIDAEYHDGWGV
jgi:hypothetical protein